jgi:hypothetical protein
MSWLAQVEGNYCPDGRIRNDLLDGKPSINIVYVYYMNQKDYEPILNKVYNDPEDKRIIRNAVENNTCPTRAIGKLPADFPSVKYC